MPSKKDDIRFADLMKRLWQAAVKLDCPRCHDGKIFKSEPLNNDTTPCSHCGFDASKGQDSADGPAVFLIFILGFLIIPLALWADSALSIPLWTHAVIWTLAILVITIGTLKPLKSITITLQYIYRPEDFETKK